MRVLKQMHENRAKCVTLDRPALDRYSGVAKFKLTGFDSCTPCKLCSLASLMSESDFIRSVRELGSNHIKADCSHEASGYRRSMDIEVSEATYNCKTGFIEILVFNISFNINSYLVFLTPDLRVWYTIRN